MSPGFPASPSLAAAPVRMIDFSSVPFTNKLLLHWVLTPSPFICFLYASKRRGELRLFSCHKKCAAPWFLNVLKPQNKLLLLNCSGVTVNPKCQLIKHFELFLVAWHLWEGSLIWAGEYLTSFLWLKLQGRFWDELSGWGKFSVYWVHSLILRAWGQKRPGHLNMKLEM